MTPMSVVENHAESSLGAMIDTLSDLLDDRLVFILFLLHEKFIMAERSRWKSYLAVYPERARSPLFFDPETELGRVAATPLFAAVQAKRKTLEREFQRLSSNLSDPEIESPFLTDGGNDVFTLENFTWADTMFRSRVFGIPSYIAEVCGHRPLSTLLSLLMLSSSFLLILHIRGERWTG